MPSDFYRYEDRCRACSAGELIPLHSFGDTPLADLLVAREKLHEPEPFAPLDLALCPACSLVQIRHTVDPTVLFGGDYPYFSSVPRGVRENARRNVEGLIPRYGLGPDSLVIEPASNDGYLLRYFQAQGIPVLGIDPAPGPARKAQQDGVPTWHDFFGRETAARLRAEGKFADLIVANNVLAHVADLNGFVASMRAVLKDTGAVSIEAPYLFRLIDGNEFDTIYHQHLCYFSLTAVRQLFAQHGLCVYDVEMLEIHGGSLRVHATVRTQPPRDSVTRMLEQEAARGLRSADCYRPFLNNVHRVRAELAPFLRALKSGGNRIAAYGAAGKATTLLSWCGLDRSVLDYVADLNPFKHGRHMGGNHLPIVPAETLREDRPDYVLLLAWNHAREIIEQEREYQRRGGRFIVPIPEPGILAPVIQ